MKEKEPAYLFDGKIAETVAKTLATFTDGEGKPLLEPSAVVVGGVDVTVVWKIVNPLRGNPQNVFDVIFMISDWILNIAGTLIVILIIYAGIRFMLSRGNPGEIGKAKNILFWALIGFTVVLIGKGFIYLVESILEGRFPTF